MTPKPTVQTAIWLSVRRYCELYDLNRKTVYKYADLGLVETWKIGRILRIRNRRPDDNRTRPERG